MVIPDFKAGGKDLLLAEDVEWTSLGLTPALLEAVRIKGFDKPTVIQAQALPLILGGAEHFIGQAKNGSGKTATFALAALSVVDTRKRDVQVLIISPSRELAVQNLAVIRELGAKMGVKAELGCPPESSVADCHVISGTPGKLEDWTRRGVIKVGSVMMVVLDEADTMLLAGGTGASLAGSALKIMRRCEKAKRVLFSATFPKRVRAFAQQVAPNAAKVVLKRDELRVDSLCQLWCALDSHDFAAKNEAITNVLKCLTAGQSMVFCNRIDGAKSVAEFLKADNHSVTLLVGKGLEPRERDERMAQFRDKRTNVLVTTDVLARGIDVPAVNLVVNYDMPTNHDPRRDEDPRPGRRGDRDALEQSTSFEKKGESSTAGNLESYLHRVGRAGRMGRRGFSLSFITSDMDKQILQELADEYALPVHEIPSDFIALRKLLKTLEKTPQDQDADNTQTQED